VLHESDLPPEITGSAGERGAINAPGPAAGTESSEHRRIRIALERAAGNRERAARVLGMSRVTLWRRMKQLGFLDPEEAAPATE
jgi:transcriptional regulator of acetoin/glycerol metabolism